jgi:hypothetical protein
VIENENGPAGFKLAGPFFRYSDYSIKKWFWEEGRFFNGLDWPESSAISALSFVFNLLTTFQTVGRGFDSRSNF